MCPFCLQIHLHPPGPGWSQLINERSTSNFPKEFFHPGHVFMKDSPNPPKYITDITTRVVKTICQICAMSWVFRHCWIFFFQKPLISTLDTLNMVQNMFVYPSPLSLHKRLIPQIDSHTFAPTKEIPSIQSVEMLKNSFHSIVLCLMERVTSHRHTGTPHISFFFFLQV